MLTMAENPKKRKLADDFSGFEREFDRMREEMEGLMEELMSRMPEHDLEQLAKQSKPGVYGFSINVSNEGKPMIREFGNVRPESAGGGNMLISEEREPLVDVIEGKADITVMVELPGVDKKDIIAKGEGRSLAISVNSAGRKYFKELELPATADFANASAKYNNGVLEIVLQRDAKGSASSKMGIK